MPIGKIRNGKLIITVLYATLPDRRSQLKTTAPLSDNLPSPGKLAAEFDTLILSASGWRKIFTVSGDEEDRNSAIGGANEVITALMADTFASFILDNPVFGRDVLIGRDTRPTGAPIADIFCRVLIAHGLSVLYAGIAAAPEIMAFARTTGPFAYISASHNPIGHNGVKFGSRDGGVFDRDRAAVLAEAFRARMNSGDPVQKAASLLSACDPAALASVYEREQMVKKSALAAYESFSREVIGGTNSDAFFSDMRTALENRSNAGNPVAILADFNGSARTMSIDRSFIEKAGLHLSVMNENPGDIRHRIVPEGESLSYCAERMRQLRTGGSGAERHTLFGYVPDCDGDRGNIVFWDEDTQEPRILEAQEVFALSAISELAFLVYSGQIEPVPGGTAAPPCAIAVNGPTSLRIDAIARAFGVRVARAEVGEANVVNLARNLRDTGTIVRFLGEGSNGGNITHPAAVRDPLNTVFALVKLLTIGDSGTRKGLFHLWCSLSGQEEAWRENFTFTDIRRTLPAFTTTSVFEDFAQLKISSKSHGELKKRFRSVFLREWEAGTFPLTADGASWQWKAVSYNGTETTEPGNDFSVSGTGGLKILFSRDAGADEAFIWMRGSGTEPVFRIMADVAGSSPDTEEKLRQWLVRMVLEADGQIR